MVANQSVETSGEDDEGRVISILSEQKSMPFLELAAVSEIDNNRLTTIISRFERNAVVRVTNHGSLVDQIVTLINESAIASA